MQADEIISALGFSRPTGYRYLRELCAAGLLAGWGGEYSLGARITELDYQIRNSDPLLQAARPIMTGLKDMLLCDVLLTVFVGGRVIVTQHVRGGDAITVSYGRGHGMPLFRGPAGRVIVANLPPARQKRLFETNRDAIARAGLGSDWASFRNAMTAIRKTGVVVAHGELDAGNVGVATPLNDKARIPPASLIMVFSKSRYPTLNIELVTTLLREGAAQIVSQLGPQAARETPGARRPSPRTRAEP